MLGSNPVNTKGKPVVVLESSSLTSANYVLVGIACVPYYIIVSHVTMA